MTDSSTQLAQLQFEFPEPKLCECGCGLPAPVAKRNFPRLGHIKGKPIRFINGHQGNGHKERRIEERFWDKVDKSGGSDACWLWTGAIANNGYGHIGNGRKTILAHRFSWEFHKGPVPQGEGYHGMCVLHRCDNPVCVNPAHLFLGTNADNIADKVAKGRSHKPKGEAHPGAKFTEAQVAEIRQRYANGERQACLAREYNVTGGAIQGIVSRKIWKHI